MSGEESAASVVSPGTDSDTLDLTDHGLEKLSRATPELILNTTTLLLDNNALTRLDNIHTYQCLEKVRISLWRPTNILTISRVVQHKVFSLFKFSEPRALCSFNKFHQRQQSESDINFYVSALRHQQPAGEDVPSEQASSSESTRLVQ